MSTQHFAFVGTYTGTTSAGLYVFAHDSETAKLTQRSTLAGPGNPTFVARHPTLPVIYAVHELDDYAGSKQGAISAARFDAETATLTPLNVLPTGGDHPCHVSVDKTGRFAFAANYSGGSVAMYRVLADGSLDGPCDFVQHASRAASGDRQGNPHAHQVFVDPTNRYVYSCDLGTDRVLIYALDFDAGKLRPHGYIRTQIGAGPRHLDFHPSGRFVYVINELDNTLNAFAVESGGALRELQSLSTLPAGYSETSYCADVHVSGDGRFVYGSNRGHNSIVVFAIDPASGTLTFVEHTKTGGDWPRNFALSPDGAFLLVANQNSDDIITFRLDAKTGRMARQPGTLAVPRPVCLLYARFG